MDITLRPGKLRGEITAISSKSYAHRAILAAALADAPTKIFLNIFSADIAATLRAAAVFGAAAERENDGVRICPARQNGGRQDALAAAAPPAALDCGESGSTLRFVLPLIAARGLPVTLSGHGRLPARPLSPLREILTARGAHFTADKLPFELSGRLTPGEYALPGDISSQYLTGLLLALPLLPDASIIRLTSPLQSAGYVAVTLEVMQAFGVAAGLEESGQGIYRIPGGQQYRAPADGAGGRTYAVEGDWSNAAFWLTANALGSRIKVNGLSPLSPQPDRAVVAVLEQMAAPGECAVDVSQFPDLAPVLAVAAALRPGTTRFVNGARLRLKESDRIAATAALVNSLGGRAAERADGLEFSGVESLTGGIADSANDHRLTMAAAVAATVSTGPVTIRGAEAADKSYPGFFADFARLQSPEGTEEQI